MGVWKKALVYLGLIEEDDLEEEIATYQEAAPQSESPVGIRKITREELSSVQQPPPPQVQPIRSAPLSQVHVVEPRAYDDAKEVGDKMRANIPVIMNLQGIEDDLFKRLTAFASGLAYGLNGRVQRLAPRVYLIVPANVEVSAEDRRRLAERGFFDEF
jgi:cell division inhibitor SepF